MPDKGIAIDHIFHVLDVELDVLSRTLELVTPKPKIVDEPPHGQIPRTGGIVLSN